MRHITRTRGPWELHAIVRHKSDQRPLVARILPHCVELRPKATRTAYRVPWASIYNLGAWLAAEETRRQRAEARKARKAARR
jgi:hypothetical protein